MKKQLLDELCLVLLARYVTGGADEWEEAVRKSRCHWFDGALNIPTYRTRDGAGELRRGRDCARCSVIGDSRRKGFIGMKGGER